MAKFTLNRRAVLRGAGSVAIALPFLEIMGSPPARAQAAASPAKRFLAVYTPGGTVNDDGSGKNKWRPTGTEMAPVLSPILAPLQPMMDKLQGMLGADESEARELMRRVKVISTARRRTPSRHFELLGSALVQRKRVWLRYFKRSDRSTSEREVSPQRLVNYRNTWYLDAWCHASEGLRRFALDAIQEAQAQDTKARHVAVKDLEAELDAGYGIYGGGGAKVKWATLVFQADAAQWVAVEEWHAQQKGRWLGDGRYELQVPYIDPTELAMDILRHGDSVEVKGDKGLVALIAQRLKSAAARYA